MLPCVAASDSHPPLKPPLLPPAAQPFARSVDGGSSSISFGHPQHPPHTEPRTPSLSARGSAEEPTERFARVALPLPALAGSQPERAARPAPAAGKGGPKRQTAVPTCRGWLAFLGSTWCGVSAKASAGMVSQKPGQAAIYWPAQQQVKGRPMLEAGPCFPPAPSGQHYASRKQENRTGNGAPALLCSAGSSCASISPQAHQRSSPPHWKVEEPAPPPVCRGRPLPLWLSPLLDKVQGCLIQGGTEEKGRSQRKDSLTTVPRPQLPLSLMPSPPCCFLLGGGILLVGTAWCPGRKKRKSSAGSV